MPAIYLPKGTDTFIFARRLAAANRGRLSHNGFLRVASPERLVIPRGLFQECFPGLEGAAAAARWGALLQRRTGHVARFSPEVIELVDHDPADAPLSTTLTSGEHDDLRAWAERLGVPQDELLRAAVRAYLDDLGRHAQRPR
ncbi:MAG: hypothetical protein HY689_11610 [Chloroflexi bacterium]|nr:hypothetical protein [Chloroflexota bacterium]